MNEILPRLSRCIMALCVFFVILIIMALATQIFSRYVLNAPVHMTDDVARIALIWLTFLGAAIVYREKGHIAVEVLQYIRNAAIRRAMRILIHVLVIAVLIRIMDQFWHLKHLMSRLDFGVIPMTAFTSKFAIILFPFGLGAALTILFALEAIIAEFRGKGGCA